MVETLGKAVAQFLRKLNSISIRFSSHVPWFLPKGVEKFYPHKNLNTNICSIIAKTWKKPNVLQ